MRSFNEEIPKNNRVDKSKPIRSRTLRPNPPADKVIEEGSDDGDSFASDTPVARGRRG